MRILLPAFLLCFVLTAMAQYDFPDYRSKKDNFNKIPQKDIRSDLAAFTIAGNDESTGKGKLKSIPATHTDASSMKFEGDNIQVIIKAGAFDKSKHKLQYYDEKHLVRINGKPYYGSYGEVPRSTIAEVT